MNAALEEPPSFLLLENRRQVLLRLTLEPDDVAAVQAAITGACGTSAIRRIEPVPRSTLVRVWFELEESAAHSAIGITLKTVSHGEIGRISSAHSPVTYRLRLVAK